MLRQSTFSTAAMIIHSSHLDRAPPLSVVGICKRNYQVRVDPSDGVRRVMGHAAEVPRQSTGSQSSAHGSRRGRSKNTERLVQFCLG